MMTADRNQPARPLPHSMAAIFRRSSLLIAEHGWCQGRGLLYVGSPHNPQAASLTGALLWAESGDATTSGPLADEALALLRARLDPDYAAPFSNWEFLCAWNDVPSRTREQTVALLVAAEHHPSQLRVSWTA